MVQMPLGALAGLFYITHIDNLASILERGILCHKRIDDEHLPYTPIYDASIVANRRAISTPDGRSLWDFTNLFFQPRNAMLYRVLHEKPASDIAIVGVQPDILNRNDIFISTGNAAHSASEILPASEGRQRIPEIRRETSKDGWKPADGSKRKMMAECLVPDSVPPEFIRAIYVPSHDAKQKVSAMLQQSGRQVIPDPNMFFRPFQRKFLPPHLWLVEGDMFFAKMHTLTVSVNCVGVMGKGLASRAKYQFPDVYVIYQDLCRQRKLRMGKPCLYKREASLETELADEPATLANADFSPWFLLFPTKRHWRERADIRGIEEGLQWIQANYASQGIRSLALPALGCGLGWLEWHDVGPLICRYLAGLDIPVWLYLPAEKQIPEEWLSEDFLLGQAS
jgi:hypothetical protein